ncbi:MAG: transglutaminase-like domain-containing protein [Balneolaceae bacterium]
MTDKNEIESLIFLLEDPDPNVQIGVKNRFQELGEQAVPLLDQYRSESIHDSERKTINEIIYNITYGSLLEDFTDLVELGINDRRQLEKAILLLARFGNPTLRTLEYSKKLDKIAQQIGSDIAYTPSLSEKMHIMLQFIFRDLRFRGDSKNYHDTENAFLDRVIDRRKGLPIILSLIVMFVSRRLDLPFHGVNMPIHFMLMYQTHNQEILIDPFDGGTIVSYDQCYYFLKKNGIEPRPEHLQKADETEILARCIRNLMHSYAKNEQNDKVKDLKNLLNIVELKG